jgi:alcohol dehydrogenase
MISRKAYNVIPKAGSIKRLKLLTEDLADPQSNEVRVAVKAIGLNFADIFAVFGLYKATPEGQFVPGLEYSGVIDAVGSEVTSVKVGDRVMGVTRFGAYATHLNIDSKYVVPIPEAWSFEEGAGFLVQALTAYYGMFELGNLQEGQTMLIHSAAGGVGIQAVRMAKKKGIFVIGTIGSEKKREFLQTIGADRIIVRGKDFPERLKEALGDRELNVVMECIGGRILKQGYEIMAPMGRMVVYGSARYAHPGDRPNIFRLLAKYITRPKIDPQNMTNENKAVMAFNLIWLYEKAHIMHEIIDKLNAMNLPAPVVGHTFEMEELPDALRLFLKGQTTGKVVVKVAS